MIAMMYRLSTRISSDEYASLDLLAKQSRRDIKNQAATLVVSRLHSLGYLPMGNKIYNPDLSTHGFSEIENAKELRLINIRLTRDEYIALAACAEERNSGLRTQARELIRQGLEFHSLLPEKAA